MSAPKPATGGNEGQPYHHPQHAQRRLVAQFPVPLSHVSHRRIPRKSKLLPKGRKTLRGPSLGGGYSELYMDAGLLGGPTSEPRFLVGVRVNPGSFKLGNTHESVPRRTCLGSTELANSRLSSREPVMR